MNFSPADRKFLFVCALLLAVFAAIGLLVTPRQAGDDRYPANSTYSGQKDGSMAAYMLLADMGYSIERWSGTLVEFSRLNDDPDRLLLVLDAPFLPQSKIAISDEREALRNFVEHGGHVLAVGRESAAILPDLTWGASTWGASKDADEEAPPAKKYQATDPNALNWHAPAVEMEARDFPQVHGTEKTEAYEGPAAVSYNLGKGQIIVWAGASALTNDGLKRSGNLQLLLNSVGGKERRILWDEHFHGDTQGLFTYIGRTPAPWLILQLLIVLAATMFTFSRRHGPLVALRAGGTRLSPLEFVDTLGALYQRKRAAPEALETAWHRFRLLLTRRLGLPPQSPVDVLAASVAQRWAVNDPEFVALLNDCDRAVRFHDVSEKDALRWITGMHSRAVAWRLLKKRGEK